MQDHNEARKALKIHGRVQGVGFRWWARIQADELGLHGYVRNCRDGTVELCVAGRAEAVAEMCAKLQHGPPAARITRLEELAVPEAIPPGFEITR